MNFATLLSSICLYGFENRISFADGDCREVDNLFYYGTFIGSEFASAVFVEFMNTIAFDSVINAAELMV